MSQGMIPDGIDDIVDDPIIDMMPDGSFRAVTRAAMRLLGQATGPSLSTLINAVDQPRFASFLIDLEPCDLRLVASPTVWWWTRARRIGTTIRLHLVDISDRRAAESLAAEDAVKSVLSALDELNDAFVIYDPEGRLDVCNRRFRELYGYSEAEARPGVHYRELGLLDVERGNVIISDSEGSEGYLERKAEYRRTLAGSFDVQLADGRWIHTRDRRMPDGGFVSIQSDITELKRHASDLLAAKERAEQAMTAGQEVNAQLEHFAYAVSHDLREPLRMVISYLDLLERRFGASFSAEAREFIEFARDGARRMDTLILDLLTYTRIGQRGILTSVDTNGLLSNVVANLSLSIAEAKATVDVPSWMPSVYGREGEFLSLFQNILSNALKYRHPGRVLNVGVDVQPLADRVVFMISDNGLGIDPRHHQRIFQIFQRLQARDQTSGTGIGLALCKKIVEGHGGAISVSSVPGEGTTFTFDLPRDPAQGLV